MDGAGEHYAKWNKPGGGRQILYEVTTALMLVVFSYRKKSTFSRNHSLGKQTNQKLTRAYREQLHNLAF